MLAKQSKAGPWLQLIIHRTLLATIPAVMSGQKSLTLLHNRADVPQILAAETTGLCSRPPLGPGASPKMKAAQRPLRSHCPFQQLTSPCQSCCSSRSQWPSGPWQAATPTAADWPQSAQIGVRGQGNPTCAARSASPSCPLA